MRRKFKKSFSTFFVSGLSGYVTEYEPHSFFQGPGKTSYVKTSYVKIPPGELFGFAQLEDPHARLKIPGMWEILGRPRSMYHIGHSQEHIGHSQEAQ